MSSSLLPVLVCTVQGKVGMAYAASARGPLGVLITVAPRGIQDALIDVRSSVDPETRLMIERGVYSVIKDAHTWRETLRLWGLEHMIIPGDWLGDVTIGVSFAPLDIVPQGASIGLAVAVAMASWLTGLVVRPDMVITGAVSRRIQSQGRSQQYLFQTRFSSYQRTPL